MTDAHFGYSPHDWEAMIDAGVVYLEQLASRRSHCDYTTFCRQVRATAGIAPEPGDHALASLLGEIARRSYDERSVVVTAIVHYKDQGFAPGPGFYAICQELGLLPAGTLSDDVKLAFLVQHQRDLEAAYQRRRPTT